MLEIDTKYNENEKLWSGPSLKSLFNADISLGHVILVALKTHGSKIAQESEF